MLANLLKILTIWLKNKSSKKIEWGEWVDDATNVLAIEWSSVPIVPLRNEFEVKVDFTDAEGNLHKLRGKRKIFGKRCSVVLDDVRQKDVDIDVGTYANTSGAGFEYTIETAEGNFYFRSEIVDMLDILV